MATKRKRGDLWVRQELILEAVRGRILTGELAPGMRVPTRDEIEAQFQASRVTIQRAFDVLVREGFVEPRGRSGTFVSARPPHLYRYLLAFPLQGVSMSGRSSFEQALVREARATTRRGPQEIVVFDGLRGPGDLGRFQILEDDVGCGRVGGLIFVGEPGQFTGSRLLSARRLPRVSLARTGTPRSMPRVELNRPAFFRQALTLLEGQRSRVALLTSRQDRDVDAQAFLGALKPARLASAPYWMQPVEVGEGDACRNLVALLMQASESRRPDALILTEELLLPEVQAGLADAGVDPARDITLVVQTYRRSPPVSSACSLGYDLRALMDTCISLIDALRTRSAEIPRLTQCQIRISG